MKMFSSAQTPHKYWLRGFCSYEGSGPIFCGVTGVVVILGCFEFLLKLLPGPAQILAEGFFVLMKIVGQYFAG